MESPPTGTMRAVEAALFAAEEPMSAAEIQQHVGEDVDVQARLPVLSTMLGHIAPAHTYWYLTATPDLLALAAQRLHDHLGDLP